MDNGANYDICQHCGGESEEVGPIKERHIGDATYIVCDSCKTSIRSKGFGESPDCVGVDCRTCGVIAPDEC